MGNCCHDSNIYRSKKEVSRAENTAYPFLEPKEFVKEEEMLGLGYSEIQSEFSVNMNTEELDRHCPVAPKAIKVREIPEDLKFLID